MSTRGVTFFTLLTLILMILSGVGGFYLGERQVIPRLTLVPISPSPSIPSRVAGIQATPSATPSVTLSPTPQVDPKTVVDTFMKDITGMSSSTTKAQDAKNLLSTDAQKAVAQNSQTSLASGIAKFAGVETVPDGGYTIGKPTITNDAATVATTWNYLSGPLPKVFYLVEQNATWKIDTIRDK